MRPRLLAGAALVALAGLVAGCGDSTPAAAPSSTSAGASGASTAPAITGDITVLAAASLTESFTELGHSFEAAHPGVKVTFSFGASSDLATQITQGAPADVFASASPKTMDTVVKDGDAAGDPTTFASNVLEIAVPPDNPGKITQLSDLAKPGLKVALCAEEVPCGAAAKTLLAADKLTVKPVSLEKDVKAALNKVELGEVDAALVYKTDVNSAGDKVKGVEIPDADKAVNKYPIVALKDAKNSAGAAAFVAYVLSDEGRKALEAVGFTLPS